MAADPFSILTVVVAPAVLTNASSVLALGTNNRLARVADRTHAVTAQLAKLEPGAKGYEVSDRRAPRSANACSTAVTSASLLLPGSRTVCQFGAHLDRRFYRGVLRRPSAFQIAAGIGVVCGASAVIALVCGCVLMIRETQLAVKGLAYDAKSHIG